jgi:hypothetical protein
MTKKEIERFKTNFRARRTSTIEHFESGYEQTYGKSHVDGSKLELGKQPDDGWVAGGSDGDPDNWRDDLTSACNAINRACTKVGPNSGMTDDLAAVLACLNGYIRRQDSTAVKAKVNKSGSTRADMTDPSNAASRSAGTNTISTFNKAARAVDEFKTLLAAYKMSFGQ